MEQWEMMIISASLGKVDEINGEPLKEKISLVEFLNDKGKEGWHIAAISGFDIYLQRRIQKSGITPA